MCAALGAKETCFLYLNSWIFSSSTEDTQPALFAKLKNLTALYSLLQITEILTKT